MTPQQTADQALSIYQTSRRQARETIAALLDEFFVGEEYTATIETVRNCMCEPGVDYMTIDDIEDVGRLTSGLKDNAKDICDLWMQRPLRRCEFGNREIDDIRKAVLGLWTILREIEKKEAA